MKTIYRVEHLSSGMGPYVDSFFMLAWCTRNHDDLGRNPGPRQDPKLADFWFGQGYPIRDQWHFGFASMDQLTKWFDEIELIKLKAMGFEVVEYQTTDEVIVSDFQCIFRKNLAVKVDYFKAA